MDSIQMTCPHCGLSMDVLLRGKPSSMIVFICSRCKSPLMRYEGEIFELDHEEFESLRKKLSRVLDALVEESSEIKREGLAEIPLWNSDDSITPEAVDEMLKLLEESKDVDDFINQI